MASWWKLIAQQLGASSSGTGSWERRAAVALGANNSAGNIWVKKIVTLEGAKGNVGSWTRRLVDPAQVTEDGSAGRALLHQGFGPAIHLSSSFLDEESAEGTFVGTLSV